MCESCWALRGAQVQEHPTVSPTRLQTVGLVLGCIAVLPIPAVQLGSLVVNIIALVRSREGPARAVRWKAGLGLGLTLLGMMILGAIIVFAAAS
jgi:hypothetical protein